MLDKLKKLLIWNTNSEKDKVVEPEVEKVEEKHFTEYLSLKDVEDVVPVNNNHNYDKKTLLFVDDYKAMESLYNIAFINNKETTKRDVYEDFNVYKIFGENCGIKALKLIEKQKIDYAILDLTLGEIVHYNAEDDNEKYVCIDGVDIASEILKHNPEAKIVFVTAHNLNTKYDKFKMFTEKFKAVANEDIEKHYINKLEEDRDQELIDFIYD